MKLSKAKTAIIGLIIVAIAWQYFGKPPSEIMTLIVVAIAGLGGYELRGQVANMKTLGKTGIEWHKYYYRVIGYFLAFGGGGLIFDELINGTIQFWPPFQHEVYGVIIGIVGLALISIKSHGKG